MKILLAAYPSSPGIDAVVAGLAAHLPDKLDRGDELVLLGRARAGWPAPRARNLIGRRGGRAILLAEEQLLGAYASRAFDLIHMTDARPLLASRKSFLLTVHDVFFVDHPEWYPRSVARFKQLMLAAAIRKRPDAIVCASHYTHSQLLLHFPDIDPAIASVIHSGVGLVPEYPSDHPVRGAAPYILSVGTIEPRKNYLTLLHAYRKARAGGFPFRWKIVGPTGYRSEAIVEELSSTEGVDLCGRVSRDDREGFYRGAAAVVTPSFAEGFGFVPLEAMRRSIPTACSSGSAFDETVGDASIRVPPADVDEWARALWSLTLDDDLRQRLVDRGRAVVARFSWDATAAGYARVYRSLVGA